MRWATTVAIGLALAGCGRPRALAVENAWVRLSAVPGRPAAGYFVVKGGPFDTTLIAVRTRSAARAELHESMAAGMRAIGSVAIPAGSTIAFAPAGRHVMLFDVDPRLKPGKTMALSLILADGRTLPAEARVVAAGEPAPTR